MKPRKDFSRHISLGLYVGVCGQYNFDWYKLFEMLYPTKINAISFFLNDGWNNPEGNYFLKKNPTKTMYTGEHDENWYAHIDRCLAAAVYWGGFRIEMCFYTSYYDTKWRSYKGYGMKLHPFVENFGNISLDGGDGRKLYENWRRTGFELKDFEHLWWQAKDNDEIISAKGSNRLGIEMVECGRRVADLCKKWHESHPLRANYWIRGFNEPDVKVVEHPNGHIEVVDGHITDPRVENWLKKEFHDRGFKNGPRFKLVRGGNVQRAGELEPAYDLLKKNANYCKSHGEIYELHSCYYSQETNVQKLISSGMPMEVVNCSLDGVKDADVAAEAKKVLADPRVKNLDIKIADTWVQPRWKSGDMNYNVKNAMPELLEVLK